MIMDVKANSLIFQPHAGVQVGKVGSRAESWEKKKKENTGIVQPLLAEKVLVEKSIGKSQPFWSTPQTLCTVWIGRQDNINRMKFLHQ